MKKKLLVSIIIPVYNGSDYVSEAIDSAINQTYKNIEIIVVNDGSTDKGATEKICLNYGDKIRYFKKNNGGVSSALNLGIKAMKGDYFSWLSHDDIYFRDKIEKQVNVLNKNNNKFDLIVSKNQLIDSNGKVIRKNKKTQDFIVDGFTFYKKNIKKTANGCSMLISKNLIANVGLFDEELYHTQDFDYWLRIGIIVNKVYYLNEVLVSSRIHKNQGTNLRNYKGFHEHSKIIQKNMEIIIFNNKTKKLSFDVLLYVIRKKDKTLYRKYYRILKKLKIINNRKKIYIFFYKIYAAAYGTLKTIYRRYKNIRYRKK
jgi:glycosyltransferase involved in cell wall biosynthesis